MYAYSLFKIQSHFPVPVDYVPTIKRRIDFGAHETFIPFKFRLFPTIQLLSLLKFYSFNCQV